MGFNAFLMVALAVTSPLIVSVACMLTIPISAATDRLLWHDSFSTMQALGGVLVVAGFALLTWAEERAASREHAAEEGGAGKE